MTTTKRTTTTKRKSTTTRKPAVKKSSTPKVVLTPSSRVDEILSAVGEERTKAKKTSILQQYNENFIKAVLIWNFDETVTSDLPPGEVPLTPKDDREVEASTIRKEWDKLYNFVKGGNDSMNRLRKETMFINICEQLNPKEAEILILVKDKKLETKYKISRDIVEEAYPDIRWGGRS
jgi:hypothetical protein